MVYSLPGALVKKLVLLHFNDQFLQAMLSLQSVLAAEYMDYAYVRDNENKKVFSGLGKDYEQEYGYAIEHHTIELYIKLWRRHHFFIIDKGTPPPCRRMLDTSTSCWNKCMGNVDTVRKVLGLHKVKRGSNTGPGSLQWYQLFNYIAYNAWRVYLLHDIHKKKMHKIKTWTQFRNCKKKRQSFRCFLDLLSCRDSFGYNKFDEYYPGLRQKLDRLNISPEKGVQTRATKVQSVDYEQKFCIPVSSDKSFPMKIYSKGVLAATSNTVEYALRLRKDLPHRIITNPTYGNNNRAQRLKCVLCCYKCHKGTAVDEHYREGRQTSKICSTCKVALCTHCDEIYHTAEILPIPSCVVTLKKHRKNNELKSIKSLVSSKEGTPGKLRKRKVEDTNETTEKPKKSQRSEKDLLSDDKTEAKDKEHHDNMNKEGIIFHEIGLLDKFNIKEIKKKNEEFEVLKKKCGILPRFREIHINDLSSTNTLSPIKTRSNKSYLQKKDLIDDFDLHNEADIGESMNVNDTRTTKTEPIVPPVIIINTKKEIGKQSEVEKKNVIESKVVDTELKKKNKNDDDSSYCELGATLKHPDDEGEGLEEGKDNSDNVEDDEKPLLHRDPVKIKPDPEEFKEKSYLCVLTRRTRQKIREQIIERMEKFGSIQNVLGDGNCAFYASIVGLEHQGIPVNTNITELRKSLYNHLKDTKKDIYPHMTFTGKKGKKTKKDFINVDVLPRLWEEGTSYKQGCSMESWLHADTMFPIMADYFRCNFIWFDVVENFTKAIVCKEVKDQEKNVMLERKGFVNPRSLCSKSIWDRRVVCIFHRNHYMALKEYVKITK